jgi:hypothetical protein
VRINVAVSGGFSSDGKPTAGEPAQVVGPDEVDASTGVGRRPETVDLDGTQGIGRQLDPPAENMGNISWSAAPVTGSL